MAYTRVGTPSPQAFAAIGRLGGGAAMPSIVGSPRVYFIRFDTDGPIKIGTAQDTYTRFHNLQCGSPVELHYLGDVPGGLDEERDLHRRFDHLRVRGEWFRSEPELLEFIDSVLSKRGDR